MHVNLSVVASMALLVYQDMVLHALWLSLWVVLAWPPVVQASPWVVCVSQSVYKTWGKLPNLAVTSLSYIEPLWIMNVALFVTTAQNGAILSLVTIICEFNLNLPDIPFPAHSSDLKIAAWEQWKEISLLDYGRCEDRGQTHARGRYNMTNISWLSKS